MSLGPSDVYDHNPETILFLGCTHGHSVDRDFDPRLVGSAPDETKDCKHAVHATSLRNYRSILHDGGMRADRLDIHFAREAVAGIVNLESANSAITLMRIA